MTPFDNAPESSLVPGPAFHIQALQERTVDAVTRGRRRYARVAMPPCAVGVDQDWKTRWLEQALAELAEADRMIQSLQERVTYLEGLSTTDELTGLLNRRGFLAHFRRELASVRRHTEDRGVLVMIDLDGFKSINDTYGHPAGDFYLRQVALLLGSIVREEDVVGRLSGDEFAILMTKVLPDTGINRARQLACQAHQHRVVWNGHEMPIRFSTGVYPFRAGDREEEVLLHADIDLYRNKAVRRVQGDAIHAAA